MNEMQKYAKSLGRHPGVPFATIFLILGFIAGTQRDGVLGGMIGAGIMSIFWVPVLWTAWTMRNMTEPERYDTTITSTLLHELPVWHPDRNRPLAGCFYRGKNEKTWKEIKSSFRIARCNYNDLGDAWTGTSVFSWKKTE